MNISVLVGLKDNLEYSKEFYRIFRNIYPNIELCFTSFGSIDGTHEWLDSLEDKGLRYYYSDEKKTFSDTFNKCVEISTSDSIIFLHNDIVVAPNFLENTYKHLQENTVVSYTAVEPPIFPDHLFPGKIVREFGRDFWNLNKEGLLAFIKEEQSLNKDKISEGVTFFMALSKKVFLDLGGFDNLFTPMFCEDHDLIRRLTLKGLNQITSLDAICYHFVSKTSRFSDEFRDSTTSIDINSNKNFIRKWQTFSRDRFLGVYDVALVLQECSQELLEILEPFYSTIYVDCDIEEYIKNTQPLTKFNLRKKLYSISDYKEPHDIEVRTALKHISPSNLQYLQQMTSIIDSVIKEGPATYLIDEGITLEINKFRNYRIDLVTLNSIYYQNKLL